MQLLNSDHRKQDVNLEKTRPRGYKTQPNFIFRLKIKRNDWLLADTCLQAANVIVFNFESETVL